MAERFTDRVAVVTGAGSGIGLEIATRFAAEGAAVAVADVDGDSASAVAAALRRLGGDALAVDVDVTDRAAVSRLVARVQGRWGRVDVLVNNAGSATDGSLHELAEADWDSDVDVVLKGAFLVTQAVLPTMVARERGVIIAVGSVNALTYLGNDAYSAAKAGLISLTRGIAVRYGRHGIRANVIAAGTVRTPAWSQRLATDPELLDRLASWYPLGRVGAPADIASAALFLASDDASWISGAVLPVDGGLSAGNVKMLSELGADKGRAAAWWRTSRSD